MHQLTKLLVFSLLLTGVAAAQVEVRWGPEAGYGVWGIPNQDAFAHSYSSYETNHGLGQSLIAGLNARWLFGKHWQLEHGLDYQISMRHTYGWYYYTNFQYEERYTNDSHWRSHQLTMPVTWGYSFQKGKVRQSFQLGARLGYLLSIVNVRNTIYTDWTYPTPEPASGEFKSNLLVVDAATRWTVQALARIETEIGKHVFVGMNFAIGKPISRYGDDGSYFSHPNTLCFLALGYRGWGHTFVSSKQQ